MNWLSIQFWLSTPNSSHFSSSQCSIGVPLTSMSASKPPDAMAFSATTFSWSTSVSHGRSVSPFHIETLAFS